jgi:hypothetical protein
MWIARAYANAGKHGEACDAIARLRRQFPESRYLRREAPLLAKQIGCQ